MDWEWVKVRDQVPKNLFARNYMKYPDLHIKIMYGTLPP